MAEDYTDKQVARYIDLYREMHQNLAILNSSLGLYRSSQQALKPHLKSPIRDFVASLRKSIDCIRTEVPEQIRLRVSVGETLDQLESLTTNTLLEIDN